MLVELSIAHILKLHCNISRQDHIESSAKVFTMSNTTTTNPAEDYWTMLVKDSADGSLCFVKSFFDTEVKAPDQMTAKRAKDLLEKALQHAILNGHLPVATHLLGEGVETTPLILDAAKSVQSVDLLDVMLDHDWDVNQRRYLATLLQ